MLIGIIIGFIAAITLFLFRHYSCRHTNAMGHCYNCPCDEKRIFDGGGNLYEQGKIYEMFILEWCLDCGSVRTVHGSHEGDWDRPGFQRSKGMRDAKRENKRLGEYYKSRKGN